MNAELERAKAGIGIDNKDLSDIDRARRKRNRLVLAVVGVVTSIVSFLVGFLWPANRGETSYYPYASMAMAPAVALTGRTKFIIAIPTLIVTAMISFSLGALLGDGIFGFGGAYSVCDKEMMKSNDSARQ